MTRRLMLRCFAIVCGVALIGGVAAIGSLLMPTTTATAQRTNVKTAEKPAPPPTPAAPRPAQIDRNGVLILIRSALLALDAGNKTGNYTVLRDLGAPGFQTNTAARLAEIFAKQRNDKLDLSGTLVIDPQLTLLPQIEANGQLHMAGFFPSVPSQVNFELLFAPVDGQWRLYGISVGLGSSTPAAPNPPAAQAAEPAAAAAKAIPAKPKTAPPPAAPGTSKGQ